MVCKLSQNCGANLRTYGHEVLQNLHEKKAALCAALIKLGAQEGTRTPTKLLAST